jgi:UDP-N-acetylmuramate-alanine ligase
MVPPWVGVITNLDADHLDFYPRGLEEIEDAFAEFAGRCDQVVAWGDDPLARASARARRCPRHDVWLLARMRSAAAGGLPRPGGSSRRRARRRGRGPASTPGRRGAQPLERHRRDRGRPARRGARGRSGEGDGRVRRGPPTVRTSRGCRRGRVLRRLRADADGDGGDGRNGAAPSAPAIDRARATAPLLEGPLALARARRQRCPSGSRRRHGCLRRGAGPHPGGDRETGRRWCATRVTWAADRLPAAPIRRGDVPRSRGARR